jgi:hypothetical protein
MIRNNPVSAQKKDAPIAFASPNLNFQLPTRNVSLLRLFTIVWHSLDGDAYFVCSVVRTTLAECNFKAIFKSIGIFADESEKSGYCFTPVD